MSRSLVLSLVLATLMALSPSGAWAASDGEGTSQCPVDAVPIQIVDDDPQYGPVTTLSAIKNPDASPFYVFVEAVTEHVAARMAEGKYCIDSAESRERSLLQFVYWPLRWADERKEASTPSVLRLDVPQPRPSGTCWLSSPLMDLTVEWKPVPRIRAIIRWNERQMFADQAVMSGMRGVKPGMTMPLKKGELDRFMREYQDTELWDSPRKPAAKPIEKRVPPDILWLFLRSMRTLTGHFMIDNEKAVEKGAAGYTKFAIALADLCLVEGGGGNATRYLHFDSIFEASGYVEKQIPLEQYMINMPSRWRP